MIVVHVGEEHECLEDRDNMLWFERVSPHLAEAWPPWGMVGGWGLVGDALVVGFFTG